MRSLELAYLERSRTRARISISIRIRIRSRRRRTAAELARGYWELVEGQSENRILEELELGWITPQRRNFRFLTSRKCASVRAGTLSAATLQVGVGAEEDESQGP